MPFQEVLVPNQSLHSRTLFYSKSTVDVFDWIGGRTCPEQPVTKIFLCSYRLMRNIASKQETDGSVRIIELVYQIIGDFDLISSTK